MESKELLAKRFWNEIFGDELDFLDLYFSTYYNEDNLIIEIDSKTNEVMHMSLIIEYDYNYCGEIIKIGYITGIATNPNYRNQGLMIKNLNEINKKLEDNNIMIACLIPANEELKNTYEKYDFVTCFNDKPLKENNKCIIHESKTHDLHRKLGYNLNNSKNPNLGMMKIINKNKAKELFKKHLTYDEWKFYLIHLNLEKLSTSDVTKLIFGNSYMNLMFDI